MLELYHWEPNGSFFKPLIALHEKALPFQGHYVDLLSFEWLRTPVLEASRETRLNQEGSGPILVHQGRQVTESLFMVEYLEDAFPDGPLRSAEPIGQARILAWARFVNEVFMPAANTLGCKSYLAPRLRGTNSESVLPLLERIPLQFLQDGWRLALTDGYSSELLEDSKRKVALSIKRIEDALGATGWLVGSAYSLADIDAFAICNSLTTLTPDIANAEVAPRMLDWLSRIRSRPAVRAALATSRTGKPEQAFAPGPEHARWG